MVTSDGECQGKGIKGIDSAQVGTDKDYLASTIAYRLDLHGTAEASVMFP
jgi:hypothetical protein